MTRSIVAGLIAAVLVAGCATSADQTYSYRANADECDQIARDIVQARKGNNSKRLRSLNQRYYQLCAGK